MKQSWDINYYNERKGNITSIVKILYEDITKDIQSQWWSIKIVRNWQEFNNINDAISSIQIFS